MNYTSVPSKVDLEDEFGVRLAYIIICFLGSLFLILNVTVLSSKQLSNSSYKFMLANTLNNLLYLFLVMCYHIYFIVTIFVDENRFVFLIVHIAIMEYLTSCMAIFNLLIQIYLTLQRIFLVLNKSYLQNTNTLLPILIISFVSLMYYVPILFIQKVATNTMTLANETSSQIEKISIVPTKFGSTELGKSVRIILSSGRIFLATILLSVVNIVCYFVYRRFLAKKSILTRTATRTSKL